VGVTKRHSLTDDDLLGILRGEEAAAGTHQASSDAGAGLTRTPCTTGCASSAAGAWLASTSPAAPTAAPVDAALPMEALLVTVAPSPSADAISGTAWLARATRLSSCYASARPWGLNEVALLPAMKTARRNFEDFAEQAVTRYQMMTCSHAKT